MELVYLWVEEYKNIKKQGFNFSPRFECDFFPKYDNGVLTNDSKVEIRRNTNYINIFPDNINVTAIVGENGSGKSSLLKAINPSWGKIYYIYSKGTFRDLQETSLYSNYPLIKDINGNKIEKNEDIGLEERIENSIFMDRNFFMELPTNGIFYILSLQSKNLYAKYFDLDRTTATINIESFHKKVLMLILSRHIMPNSFFNPNKIQINFNRFHKEYDGSKVEKVIAGENLDFNYKYIYKIYLKSLEIIKQTKAIENRDKKKAEQTKLMKTFLKDRENILNFELPEDEDTILILDKEEKIDKFLAKFTYDDSKILRTQSQYSFQDFKNFEILKNDDYEIFFYLVKIGFLEYDFLDNQKRFLSLSTGEKNLFSDFIILNKELRKGELENIFILLDEPDTTLHPQWQKKYVSEILKLLEQYSHINFHLIITSHSPFILSDIPKENVIFLEKGKQVYPFGDNQQTFGANIHTLLSHGFFMRDGLMGEFAKSKIEDVINYLNDKESTIKDNDEAQKLLNIIGEPIIKNQLQKMLDSKRLSKIDEIDKIKLDMENLAKRLVELEK